MNTKSPRPHRNKKAKPSFYSMLSYSFWELFSPESDRALLNYKELYLLDLDQLKLIDINQLKLLNLSILAMFVQYVGALSVIVLILGSVAFRVLWDTSYYSSVLSFSRLENRLALEKSRYSFEVHSLAYETNARDQEAEIIMGSPSVLGARTSVAEEVIGSNFMQKSINSIKKISTDKEEKQVMIPVTSQNACSFSFGKTLYSSGTEVVLDKSSKSDQKMCIRTSADISNASARVKFGGDSNEQSLSMEDGCFTPALKKNGQAVVNVTLIDKSDESNVSSCGLLVSASF